MSKLCECGVEIVFATSPTGKAIPLNAVTHIYRIEGEKAVPIANCYQSHFLTCTKAEKFSGRNRAGQQGADS